jgi:hypothetical protein
MSTTVTTNTLRSEMADVLSTQDLVLMLSVSARQDTTCDLPQANLVSLVFDSTGRQ